jgi:hypothetical protein
MKFNMMLVNLRVLEKLRGIDIKDGIKLLLEKLHVNGWTGLNG